MIEKHVHPDSPCDDPECQICCDHDEHDHGICLDCGKDNSEAMAADAYDRAKSARQEKEYD